MAHDIFKIPNLITIGRLIFLIPVAYFLSEPGAAAKIYALAFLVAAAVSDYLDGFFARLLNQQTRLGMLLDPLSDKILAGVLAVLLIIHRDFPIWMAAVIVGRDLLIAIGGLNVKARISQAPSSILTGKYCFASIAVLLCSYVIEFEFGIRLFTIITLIFIFLSLVMYGRIFVAVGRGRPPQRFADRPLYRNIRVGLVWIVSAIFLYKLGQFIGWL